MNLTGKIGKGILWSAVGYVAWLVVDYYTGWGMPSRDPLTNFFVFLGLGGAVYWIDQNRHFALDWLWRGNGRLLPAGIGWAVSAVVLANYFHYPLSVAIPFSVPMPVLAGVAVFLAYQGVLVLKWVLF